MALCSRFTLFKGIFSIALSLNYRENVGVQKRLGLD